MSKRTASKLRRDVVSSCPVVESLKTDSRGRRVYKKVESYSGNEMTLKCVVSNLPGDAPDKSKIDLSRTVVGSKREVATLLVPDRTGVRKRCRAYLAASGAKWLGDLDGVKTYSLKVVPKDMLVPALCELVIATIPAPGTGTDQHVKETRGGHALRRDYSAKKGPKRTYRIDGLPNGEELDRPIQGNPELTGARNRPEAADCYWR